METKKEIDNYHYFFCHPTDEELIFVAECFKNNDYYRVEFEVANEVLKIGYITTNSQQNKGKNISYQFQENQIKFTKKKIKVNLDCSFELNDRSIISFKVNQIFDKNNDVYQYRFDIFDKLNDQFTIKYIEDLISSGQLYRNSSFVLNYIEIIFQIAKKIVRTITTNKVINFEQKLDTNTVILYAQEFFKKQNIKVNVKELIDNSTIKFSNHYPENTNSFGNSFYDDKLKKKLIIIKKTDNLLMLAVLVHEIMHYLNQPEDNQRSTASEYLTEVVSYSYELILLNEFLNTDIGVEALFLMDNIVYSLIYCIFFIYSPMLSLKLYKENQKITKEEIEKYLKFENYKEEMRKYIKGKRTLDKDIWNVIGYFFSIYIFMEYQKNPQFKNKILELHHRLNKKDFLECLKIININNIDDISNKAINSIDAYITFIKQTKKEKNFDF